MNPRARLLPALVRAERFLHEVAPQEAGELQDLIQLTRAMPALAPAPLPLFTSEPTFFVPESRSSVLRIVPAREDAVPEPRPKPLRKFVRPPAKKALEAIPQPVEKKRRQPVKKKHLTLVQPPEPAPPPAEVRREVPPDPLGEKMREAEGARALLLEIVRRAAFDWVLYRSSTRLDQKALAEDAYMWLFVEDEEHPHWKVREDDEKEITGFVAICDALELDVERVRSWVRKLTPNRVMSSGRPPENSRASDHAPNITLHTKVDSDSGGDGGGSIDFDALITGLMDYDG